MGAAALTVPSDTVSPGESVTLPLSLGSGAAPVDSIYGLAFSIAYDPKLIKPNVRFKPTQSWFGDPANLLWLQRDFHAQGRIDVAVTRTDGKTVSGHGKIGDMIIVIEDNIFLDPAGGSSGKPDSILKTILFFRGLHPVSTAGRPNMLNSPPVDLIIRKPTVSTHEPGNLSHLVHLLPNPANDQVQVFSPQATIQTISISDFSGRNFPEIQPEINPHRARFQVGQLPAGVYVVRTGTSSGMDIQKLVVIH